MNQTQSLPPTETKRARSRRRASGFRQKIWSLSTWANTGSTKLGTTLEPIVFVGLLILLLWLPIPLGSNRDWAKAIFEFWIGALTFLQILVMMLKRDQAFILTRSVCVLFLLWGLWIIWVGFQAWELPTAWMQDLSSHRYEVEMQSRELLGQAPLSMVSMSLDPQATRASAYESIAYVLFFGLIWATTQNSINRRVLFLGALLLSGCLQVGYSIYLRTSGLHLDPLSGQPIYFARATGTFVNPNHFAGYLELTMAACLGLLGAWPSPAKLTPGWKGRLSRLLGAFDVRILASRITIAVLFAGLFLSQSRMGNTAALSGLVIGVIASFIKATGKKSWIGALVFIVSILLFDITFIGSQYGGDKLAARMQTAVADYTVDDRALLRPDLDRMVQAFWRSGSGLGSFATVYPEFRTVSGNYRISHSHNDYYEFLIETGVIGVLLLGLIILLSFVHAARLLWYKKDPKIRAVAITGLVAIVSMGVHSTVDFNLQIPSNALTFVGILGLVWSCRVKSDTPIPPNGPFRKQ